MSSDVDGVVTVGLRGWGDWVDGILGFWSTILLLDETMAGMLRRAVPLNEVPSTPDLASLKLAVRWRSVLYHERGSHADTALVARHSGHRQ
jgi:hypothetical protein